MSKGLQRGQIERILKKETADINRKFWQKLADIDIAALIVGFIQKGISPVANAGNRFKQYAQSYIDQIQGQARYFRTPEGRVVRVEPSGGKTKNGKSRKPFEKGLGVGKKVSPVNLTVTGDMMKGMIWNKKTGFLSASHKVGDYDLWALHNEGTDKLPIRRLLPNKPGERFNRRIEQRVTEALAVVLGQKTSKVKKFLSIKFNIK